jgi:hypothetical protein
MITAMNFSTGEETPGPPAPKKAARVLAAKGGSGY